MIVVPLANTLLPEDFPKFISEKIKSREIKVINKKQLTVKALPEFVKQFKNTNFISCKWIFLTNCLCLDEKGKSHHLIKGSFKRSRDEFEDRQRDLQAEQWNHEKQRMIMQIENLKAKISDMEVLKQAYLQDSQRLAELYDKGAIDESGVMVVKKRDEEMKE